MPSPIYVQPNHQIVTLNNNQIPIPGSIAISGNVPRTFAGWWRTTQNDPYNIYECGRVKRNGEAFALGRWFGEFSTSSKGLTCHTDGGCFKDDVGRNGKDVGPSDNAWHHFGHVWDGSTHYLCYDGELYSQGRDTNGKLNTFDNGCILGSYEYYNFIGDIKGLHVYRDALTLQQIKKIKG